MPRHDHQPQRTGPRKDPCRHAGPAATDTDGTAPQRIDPDLVYTPKEAAEFLRVSPRTLERWRSDGSGPKCTRYGRVKVVYRGQALLTFLDRVDAGAAA
jgi:hypothetical protein